MVDPSDLTMKVAELASRMAYSTYQVERFRILNSLGGNDTVRPGQRIKLVVYGSR